MNISWLTGARPDCLRSTQGRPRVAAHKAAERRIVIWAATFASEGSGACRFACRGITHQNAIISDKQLIRYCRCARLINSPD